jgi:hypothetical protein
VGGLGVGGPRGAARRCGRVVVVPRSGDGMGSRSVRGVDARRGGGRRVGCCRGDVRREDARRWVEGGRRSRYLFRRSRTWSLAICV